MEYRLPKNTSIVQDGALRVQFTCFLMSIEEIPQLKNPVMSLQKTFFKIMVNYYPTFSMVWEDSSDSLLYLHFVYAFIPPSKDVAMNHIMREWDIMTIEQF